MSTLSKASFVRPALAAEADEERVQSCTVVRDPVNPFVHGLFFNIYDKILK